MKKYILVLLATLSACSQRVTDLDSLCRGLDNSYDCAKKIEEYQLPFFKDIVKRTDDKLILKTDNNSDVILENTDKEEDGVWYSFRDYFKGINSYLVTVNYYEGGEYYLVNKKSGGKILIPGLIKISPDGKRLVSYNVDLEAQYSGNKFVIYRVTDTGYVKEMDTDLSNWGPSDAKWINNNQLEFEKSELKDSGTTVTGKVVYVYDGNWKIRE